jgi:hypothetical protein
VTDYDPRTSYATDYELWDLQETADWEPENQALESTDEGWRQPHEIVVAEISDVNSPDYISVTLGVDISPTSKVFVCGNSTGFDFDLQVNDVIVTTEPESHMPGRWLVNNVVRSPFSHWVAAVDKARENDE